MNGPIPFTDVQLRTMAVLYAAGTSITTISNVYGISTTSVRDRLHAMGIVTRKRGAPMKMSRATFDRVDRLRDAGWTWKQIVKRIGYDGTAKNLAQQYHRVELMGVAHCFGREPKWSSYPAQVLELAKAMHDSGLSWPAIAGAFGASPTSLNHAVMRLENESCA